MTFERERKKYINIRRNPIKELNDMKHSHRKSVYFPEYGQPATKVIIFFLV